MCFIYTNTVLKTLLESVLPLGTVNDNNKKHSLCFYLHLINSCSAKKYSDALQTKYSQSPSEASSLCSGRQELCEKLLHTHQKTISKSEGMKIKI